MPSVMGTPGFMAPEILVAGEHANRLTDLHSLAVLLYQLLFRRHPLRGKRVLSTKSVVEDEMLSLGQKPLFVEDPNDDSNRPGELAETIATLGIPLERLFLEAFCEGLAYPELRPSAEAWERAFLRTMDYLVPRQDGDWEIRPQQHCQNPEQAYLQFFAPRDEQEDLDEGHALALYHGCPIYRWHLERNTTREYENIDPQSRLGIVFRSGERWVFANEQVEHLLDNQRRTLPSGALIDLAQAGTLDYSSKRFGRRLVYSRGKSASIGTSTS